MWQTSSAGPFTAWPTGGGGFEYFYGFIGGENNQWDPALYKGTTTIEPPKTPAEGYYLTEDLTAIGLLMSDAVRLLLHRVVINQAFPLELNVPNVQTRVAMDESRAMMANRRARFATSNALSADFD